MRGGNACLLSGKGTIMRSPTLTHAVTALIIAMSSCEVLAADAAYDTASNTPYGDGWQTGDNGGFGFGAWALSATSGNGSENGHFVGSGGSAFGTSWGMYANSGNTANAVRPFTGSLSVGQTFSISMDNGNVDTGGTVGLGLQTSGGTNRMEFFFVGGGSDYRYLRTGVMGGSEGTGIGFTLAGLRIFVTPQNSTDVRLRVTNADESSELFNQIIVLANASDIAQVRLFNANAGDNTPDNSDLFFDDVAVPEPTAGMLGLAGLLALSRRRRA